MRYNRRSFSLNGTWTLSGQAESAASKPQSSFAQAAFRTRTIVPGNIELALEEAGKVPELFKGRNNETLRVYEFYEWLYETDFDYDGSFTDPVLVFDGIDCFGTVYLNGIELGQSKNAFVSQTFVTKNALKNGKNHLAVHLGSATGHLKDYPMLPGARAGYEYNAEAIWARKPAHVWGWDIAPRMALGGLWRGVRLEEVPKDRIEEVFLDTINVSDHAASLRLCIQTATPALFEDCGLALTVAGQCGDHAWTRNFDLWSSKGDFLFEVENPKLWDVRNYGEANLYDVTVTLKRKSGEVLAEERLKLGIRLVELVTRETCSEEPTPDFQFWVNHRPVRIFGTNHVPLDACHSRDAQRYELFFSNLLPLNCNMIRAWGGGVYEDDAFFDFCDAHGILVWQDFMMGCALYPDHPAFCNALAAEAEAVVRKLRQHPSLALWAGDNECDLAGSWYGIWRDPNENRLTRELLPGISRMLDPMRPYLASSPFISPQSWRLSREKKCDPMEFAAEQHLWGPRDFFKSAYYRNSRTSFTSETGFHGSPALDSIQKFIPEDHLALREDDEMWLYHASAPFLASSDQFTYRIPLMYKQIRNYFGVVPETLAGFVQASQIVQAEALKYTIELHKQRPKRSGVLWWNLLDCWPQFSDAVIDYYGVRKLAYDFIRIVQNPLLGMISEEETAVRSVIIANDTATDAEGEFTAEDVFSGEVLAAGAFRAPARSVTTAGSFALDPAEKRLLCVRWKCADGRSGVNHNLTGQPVFDFAFYTQKVLPALARIYGNMDVIA